VDPTQLCAVGLLAFAIVIIVLVVWYLAGRFAVSSYTEGYRQGIRDRGRVAPGAKKQNATPFLCSPDQGTCAECVKKECKFRAEIRERE
jgi:hypothetical protein